MKLADLNPGWLGAGGPGITRAGQPVPERHGIGIVFDCPCGCDSPVHVLLKNPLDGGPAVRGEPLWQRTGDTFETLTLHPSIRRIGGCQWHGWVRDGEITP